VSTLWTPGGDQPSEPRGDPPGPPGAPGGEPDDAEVAEELRRIRAELAAAPVPDLIANHAVGLWQLAVLHLVPDEGEAPHLADAALAIDALAALVDSVGDRLERHAEPLRDALAQLRLAFVQVQERGGGDDDAP
jgi:hypothetical protein